MTSASFVIFNHKLYPSYQTHIPYSDRGFLFGDGVFETMRVTNHQIPLLSRHYQRLVHGCRVLRLPVPHFREIQHSVNTLLSANLIDEGSIRLSLSRGSGPRGLSPPINPHSNLLITSAVKPHNSPQPVKLFISQHRRDEHSVLSGIKSLNALPNILARIDAQEHGADDALMLNYGDHITETSSATFLAHDGHTLFTPPLSDGVLPGISRARLLEAGVCQEKTLTLDTITRYKGAWIITALSLTPVFCIGEHHLPLMKDDTQHIYHIAYNT